MKKPALTAFPILVICLIPILTCAHSAYADDETRFHLRGLEAFKGIDIGQLRIGTAFGGEVCLDYDCIQKLGQWTVMLSYKGAEQVEACEGMNDIVSLKLTVVLTDGEYAGNTLVLGMRDWSGTNDVHWQDWVTTGDTCRLKGTGCPTCDDRTIAETCKANDHSNIAYIDELTLSRQKGSTLAVKSAQLQNGRLCHYFPVVPRVYGELLIEF